MPIIQKLRCAPAAHALFSYGFRPFFLLGAAWALVAMLGLLGGLAFGAWPLDAALPLARWHAHEMLFGFVAAAIAGFLLTAVPAWTSSEPVRGLVLAAVVVVWMTGRIVMLPMAGLYRTPWILLAALFFPVLAAVVGAALVRSRNYRNFQFMLVLMLLAAADFAFLIAELGWIEPLPFDPLRFAANLVMLMIAVVGGRIVPVFTRNALLKSGVQSSITPSPWLDRASLAAAAAVVLVDAVRQDTALAGWTSAAAALLLGARMSRWQGLRTLALPIVWILHAGYAWVVVALALKAAWLIGHPSWAANWLHALTAGAFGTMILGVMTRVALGHTGRALRVARPIVAAYVLAIAGAALRIWGPIAWPLHYVPVTSAAALAWASAFAIFLAVYSPILLGPRVDEPSAGNASPR
jgi:uncharacterized protein involved in response to NO